MNDQVRLLLAAGATGALLAAVSWLADWRRQRRKDPDRVGFMPWTMLFFLGVIAALALLGLAGRLWLSG